MTTKHVFFFAAFMSMNISHGMEPDTSHIPIRQEIGVHELTSGEGPIKNDYFFKFRRKVQKWIARGANINCCSPDGMFTPLSKAAFSGNLRACQILLELGADVNGAAAYYTPLAAALRTEAKTRYEICQLFLAHGADINIRSARSGETPLMVAVSWDCLLTISDWEHSWPHRPSVADLLAMGADPLVGDIKGNNALMRAAGFSRNQYHTLDSNRQLVYDLLKFIVAKEVCNFTFLCCLKRLQNTGSQYERYIANVVYQNRRKICCAVAPSLRTILEARNKDGQTAYDFAILRVLRFNYTDWHAVDKKGNYDYIHFLNPRNMDKTRSMFLREINGGSPYRKNWLLLRSLIRETCMKKGECF